MLSSIVIVSLLFIKTFYALETPIVGILSLETFSVNKVLPNENYDSYIAASYVKFLESSSARVIPIWIGQNRSYYERAINYTNGMLFPGGATYFNETDGYGVAAKIIFELAKEANDRGVHYPIFGTCLGLQVLAFADVGEDIRSAGNLKKVAVPLEFVEGFNQSTLYGSASQETIDILGKQSVTYNYHMYCLKKTDLETAKIDANWRILSVNHDEDNVEFISSMESKKYPFFGVQFHPEKIMYEFKKSLNIPHFSNAVRASQYFGITFVEECKKNNNTFPSWETEQNTLIYNFNPFFTAIRNSSFEQIYAFTKDDFEKYQLIF